MQVILNDFSLNGQFLSVNDFIDSILKKTIPILLFCEQNGYELLKSYNSWNCKVTKQETLQVILQKNGYPEIQKIKSLLTQVFYQEPYWEKTSKSDITKQIIYKGNPVVSPSCVTEAFFRNGLLLSFFPSEFAEKVLQISVNKKEKNVYNSIDKRMFLECLNIKKVFLLANSFLLPNSNLKIEIRTSETLHNEPHFHVSKPTGKTNATIFFKDFSIHEGKMASRDKQFLNKWLLCAKNKNRLFELWNYYHPEKMIIV